MSSFHKIFDLERFRQRHEYTLKATATIAVFDRMLPQTLQGATLWYLIAQCLYIYMGKKCQCLFEQKSVRNELEK